MTLSKKTKWFLLILVVALALFSASYCTQLTVDKTVATQPTAVTSVTTGVGVGDEAGKVHPTAEKAEIQFSSLTTAGQRVYRLIREGGPFKYAKDGSNFGNYERVLPSSPKGYYKEYSVTSNLAVNRGKVRIVCGGWRPRVPDVCYYTEDHYASFKKIAP